MLYKYFLSILAFLYCIHFGNTWLEEKLPLVQLERCAGESTGMLALAWLLSGISEPFSPMTLHKGLQRSKPCACSLGPGAQEQLSHAGVHAPRGALVGDSMDLAGSWWHLTPLRSLVKTAARFQGFSAHSAVQGAPGGVFLLLARV